MDLDILKWFDEDFEYPFNPNVTKSLSGQSITSTEGAIAAAIAYSAVGQAVASALGTVSPAVSYGLTGQTIASTEGAMVPGVATGLAGQAVSSTLGTITPSVAYPLAGQAIASTEGTPTPEIDYAISGQAITSTEGIITATAGSNVSITLTGLTATFALGNISVTGGDIASGGGPRQKRKYLLDGKQYDTLEEALAALKGNTPAKVEIAARRIRVKNITEGQRTKWRPIQRSAVASAIPNLPRFQQIPQIDLVALELDRARERKRREMMEEEEIAVALLHLH